MTPWQVQGKTSLADNHLIPRQAHVNYTSDFQLLHKDTESCSPAHQWAVTLDVGNQIT